MIDKTPTQIASRIWHNINHGIHNDRIIELPVLYKRPVIKAIQKAFRKQAPSTTVVIDKSNVKFEFDNVICSNEDLPNAQYVVIDKEMGPLFWVLCFENDENATTFRIVM